MNRRAWAALLLSASVGLCVWLAASDLSWEAWRPSTCMPDSCFCEADRGGPIRQPADTWSCLVYVLVGALILGWGPPMAGSLPATAVFGLLTAFIGVASVAFHASLTFQGEWLDGMSMHLFPAFLIADNMRRGGKVGERGFLGLVAGIGVASALWFAFSLVLRKEMFGALLAGIVVSDLWASRKAPLPTNRWLKSAFGTFAAAFGIWLLDQYRIVCAPQSWVQGHAVWHFLCAAAIGMLYLHYKEEAGPRR